MIGAKTALTIMITIQTKPNFAPILEKTSRITLALKLWSIPSPRTVELFITHPRVCYRIANVHNQIRDQR